MKRPDSKKSLQTLLVLFPLLFFFSSVIIRHLLNPSLYVNLDVATTLYTARQMVAGKSLYIDWQVLNPPGIYILYLACFKLAQTLPLSPLLIFYSFAGILACLGAGLIQRSGRPKSDFLALAYSFFVIAVSMNGYRDFMEREYLFMIAFIPYMVIRSRPLKASLGKIALFFFAGYCATLKPQFFLFLILLETYFHFQKNPLKDLSLSAVYAGLLTPFVTLYFLDKNSLAFFFQNFVSLYWYYDIGDAPSSPFSFFEKIIPHLPVVFFALGILFFPMKRFRRDNKDLYPLFLITLFCALISLISQNKYWPYHGIPLFAVGLVYWIYFLLTGTQTHQKAKTAFVCVALFALIIYHHLFTIPAKPRYHDFTSRFSYLVFPGETVLPISYSCKLIASHYYSHIDFSGRWIPYFTLNGLYKHKDHDPFARENLEKIKEELLQAIKSQRPKLILVDREQRGSATSLREVLYNHMKVFPMKGYTLISPEEAFRLYPGGGTFDVWFRGKPFGLKEEHL